jgi:hypothetical protein
MAYIPLMGRTYQQNCRSFKLTWPGSWMSTHMADARDLSMLVMHASDALVDLVMVHIWDIP